MRFDISVFPTSVPNYFLIDDVLRSSVVPNDFLIHDVLRSAVIANPTLIFDLAVQLTPLHHLPSISPP